MKTPLLTAAMLALVATPAFALKVTNLDKVPHTVVLSTRGMAETVVIAPNATEIFSGATQGFLSLKDAEEPKGKKGKKKAAKKPAKDDSVVHADGMLSGIIGNERTGGMPTDPLNNYVIWPGGDLRLQSKTKQAGRW